MADFETIVKELDQLSQEELRKLSVIVHGRLAGTPPTEREFEEMLEAQGAITRPRRENSRWHTEPFTPVSIEGEPLSETVIRERR